jgi:phosphatidylglycerol:prolipoprotein diacylglycerol transferase
MFPPFAEITISMPPSLDLGPVTIAWHGLMIGLGILAGSLAARRYGAEAKLDLERLFTLTLVLVIVGIVGTRVYYLLENDAGALLRPGDWLGQTGFAFYGALIFGIPAAGAYLWRQRLSLRYLDALSAGFPLGMAIGRIGDVINGEHYGPATSAPWGFRYTDPDAAVPSPDLAYQSGAFYEVLLALLMLAALWPLRHRFRTPGLLLCVTVAAYAIGRFLIFFIIRDTDVVALGLRQAQLTSLALLGLASLGSWLLVRAGGRLRTDPDEPSGQRLYDLRT